MTHRLRSFGLLVVFLVALLDASQELLIHQEFNWSAGLATVAIAAAATLPLLVVEMSYRAARSGLLLARLLGWLYFALAAALLLVWVHQVYLGGARPEGAAQMHLLFVPAAGILFSLIAVLVCYVTATFASALSRVTPNPSVKGTSRRRAAPYVER